MPLKSINSPFLVSFTAWNHPWPKKAKRTPLAAWALNEDRRRGSVEVGGGIGEGGPTMSHPSDEFMVIGKLMVIHGDEWWWIWDFITVFIYSEMDIYE
jgi:hypothetical protein